MGIVLAVLGAVAVWAALWRSAQLCREFGATYRVPEGYPAIMSRGPRRLGHAVARSIGLCFATAWAVLLTM